jgi:hypothetical protein
MHRHTAFHGNYYRTPYNYRHIFEYPWQAAPHEPLDFFTSGAAVSVSEFEMQGAERGHAQKQTPSSRRDKVQATSPVRVPVGHARGHVAGEPAARKGVVPAVARGNPDSPKFGPAAR